MTLVRILIAIAIGAVIGACALTASPPAPDYSDLVITLERTPCFGACPVYKLAIYGDGRVMYAGQQFVAVTGQQTTTLSAEQVQELVSEIERADYFSLKDEYTAPATDMPSAIVSVSLNRQTKTINHYGYCGAEFDEAPKELCDLEQKVDEITNSAQWVGRP